MLLPYFGEVFFRQIELVYLIIPLFFLLLFIINKNFVKLDANKHKRRIARRGRIFLLLSRTVAALLLLLALASPYSFEETRTEGNPRIAFLVDNSTSMEIFDLSFVGEMRQTLTESIPTTIRYIGVKNKSSISEGVFSNFVAGNIVLVSDGNNYKGKDLTDTLLLGMSQNISLSFIHIEPNKNEISVTIEGPSKVVEGVENEYLVKINRVLTDDVSVKVTIDGKVEMNKITKDSSAMLKKTFLSGRHKIVAEINGKDTFSENNIFYKTVEVIDKPKILYLTKDVSPMLKLLEKLYDVDTVSSLPLNIEKYLVIVVNDMSVDDLDRRTVDRLTQFANLGDGLIFVGGENSFDYGGYKGSYIETLLPAKVGKGRELPSKDVNVVILIDKSSSTGMRYSNNELGVNLEKDIAINIINQVDPTNHIGVIAFNERAELISGLVPQSRSNELIRKIVDIKPWGGTNMKDAIVMAIDMLKEREGSRNIIIISDGKDKYLSTYLGDVRDAAKQGIVTHTVNIGASSDERTMKQIASVGSGNFFSPESTTEVKVVFSKPEENWPLMILPKNHFISEDMKLTSYVTGFNQVLPKSTGLMLASTVYGDPLFIAGRYGLGRIGVLATDDGGYWSSSLLKKDPKFISRIMNWAIENPERKKDSYIQVGDARLGEETSVYVKSSTMPEELQFSKIDFNLYRAIIDPEETGFSTALGKEYGISYHKELEQIGLNNELLATLSSMGANIYRSDETSKIVEAAKQSSIEMVNSQKNLSFFLIVPALILLLFEIIIRRVFRYRKLYK